MDVKEFNSEGQPGQIEVMTQTRTLGGGGPTVAVSWSCPGSVSIKDAKDFHRRLGAAIAHAEGRPEADVATLLADAEFLLRKCGTNWREAASMADSMKRSASDIREALAVIGGPR